MHYVLYIYIVYYRFYIVHYILSCVCYVLYIRYMYIYIYIIIICLMHLMRDASTHTLFEYGIHKYAYAFQIRHTNFFYNTMVPRLVYLPQALLSSLSLLSSGPLLQSCIYYRPYVYILYIIHNIWYIMYYILYIIYRVLYIIYCILYKIAFASCSWPPWATPGPDSPNLVTPSEPYYFPYGSPLQIAPDRPGQLQGQIPLIWPPP